MGKILIGVNMEFVRHADKSFEWGVQKAAELGYKYIEPMVHWGRELLSEAGVDFVHLTERDADRPMQAWQPLQVSRVCHNPQDARRRWLLGASWLVVSPIFATPSKPGATPLGSAGLAVAVHSAPGRVVALGGITAEHAQECLAAGAVGVAVQRAAWTNVETLVRSLGNA